SALVTINGKQPGDPARAARAVVETIRSGEPPHRLVLGNTGYEQVVAKLEAMLRETRDWEQVSRSTDFPETDHRPGAYV
ncbi:MAG TPA: hypothetical protein VHZ97_21125, partial [Pseudonocardiaceae bacterium]|nr:hypothetical protein [Pseudonocardiaceae bacterium]